MDRKPAWRAGAAALSVGLIAALLVPANATAAPSPATATPSSVTATSPEIIAAMQRDLSLTPAQVLSRLAREDSAARTEQALRAELGTDFAGAWLTAADQQLVVAITDASQADEVRAAGAQPQLVDRSERQLNAAKSRLDRASRPSRSIAGWYVDVASNTVVVLAKESALAAAERFVANSGADADAVKVVVTTENPVPLVDVRGGDAYYPGNSRCSVGFSVNGGFVTAGHCGGVGTTTRGVNQQAQGTVRGSVFPGSGDYGWVQVNSNWTPTPLVNRYSGSQTVTVTGGQEAAVGASICRSGSTTGWRCGTIQAKNATVNYPQGSVTGLTRTNACAEGGDSGGSWLSGSQAQGVTSGGSGNCTTGGTTFFQPLGEILSAFGLTLVTSGGGNPPPPPPPPPGPPPPPPPGGCSGDDYTRTDSLSGSGNYDIHPNGSYYQSGSGTHSGCLAGPSSSSVDFDLYLQRWSGFGWSTVATSLSPGNTESITFNGSSGYYRWIAYSFSGSGSYTIGLSVP